MTLTKFEIEHGDEMWLDIWVMETLGWEWATRGEVKYLFGPKETDGIISAVQFPGEGVKPLQMLGCSSFLLEAWHLLDDEVRIKVSYSDARLDLLLWRCILTNPITTERFIGEGPTQPFAICRAYLLKQHDYPNTERMLHTPPAI